MGQKTVWVGTVTEKPIDQNYTTIIAQSKDADVVKDAMVTLARQDGAFTRAEKGEVLVSRDKIYEMFPKEDIANAYNQL